MLSKIKPWLVIIIPVILVIISSYYLQGLVLSNQEELARWLLSFGPYIIFVYIILQIITIIVAPIGGFALVIAMIALFGPGLALVLTYLVVTPTYLLNFYLARRYGRPLVQKVIGKLTMEKIDHYVKDAGLFTLIILRCFQGGNFDYLSYGYGLTRVPFKTFALVNFLAGVPGIILSYFILKKVDNLTLGVILLYIVAFSLAGIPLYLNHFKKKHL